MAHNAVFQKPDHNPEEEPMLKPQSILLVKLANSKNGHIYLGGGPISMSSASSHNGETDDQWSPPLPHK